MLWKPNNSKEKSYCFFILAKLQLHCLLSMSVRRRPREGDLLTSAVVWQRELLSKSRQHLVVTFTSEMSYHGSWGKYVISSRCWDQIFAWKAKYDYRDPNFPLSVDVCHLLSFSTADNNVKSHRHFLLCGNLIYFYSLIVTHLFLFGTKPCASKFINQKCRRLTE